MRRVWYVVAAVGTIAVGLAVFRGPVPLGATLRDIVGDSLWATMMVWWVSALVPGAARRLRGAMALGICWVVEASQLVHTPPLDDFRATTIGHLLLGSGFDARDLLAYTLGVAVAMLLDAVVIGKASTDSGR